MRLHYRNPAGDLLEEVKDEYLLIRYFPGPRRFSDLQTLLGHAKQQLAVRGWNKVLGDHRTMTSFSPEEVHWMTTCWLDMSSPRRLYGAVLLPVQELARPEEKAAAALTYRLFTDEAAAASWLTRPHHSKQVTYNSLRKSRRKVPA